MTNTKNWILTALGLALLASPLHATAQVAVVGVQGTAELIGTDGRVAPLRCGDSIAEGATIRTGSGGSVGLIIGDLFAQLGDHSRMSMRRGATGPDLNLQTGRLRVVDVDTSPGAYGTVSAAGTVVSLGTGSDLEAHLLDEKAGQYAILCEYASPVQLARGEESRSLDPGSCVVANPREALFASQSHQDRIALADADGCGDVPVLGDVAQRFMFGDRGLPDVAAGPPGPGFPGPFPVGAFDQSPCDQPGLPCSGIDNRGVTDPDPIDLCAPGITCLLDPPPVDLCVPGVACVVDPDPIDIGGAPGITPGP